MQQPQRDEQPKIKGKLEGEQQAFQELRTNITAPHSGHTDESESNQDQKG
jgi:hypothetical protein